MPHDRFGIPFFYPSKSGGFFYEMSDNPKSDDHVDWPSEMSFSGAVATMHPNGPTDFGIGKNIKGFSDSIGGCKMDFKATQARGYAYKADDARDVEIKCLAKFAGLDSESGFSISATTGHHSGSGCCQGFAYMATTEVTHNPSDTRFRKEIWHVDYNETPKDSTVDLPGPKINGNGKFVGLGFCRYNTIGQESTSVTLEFWYNPDPETEPTGWFMVNRYVDKPNGKWANGGGKCNGDPDQVGTWSNAQNRLKTNSGGGTIQFKAVTLREINPGGSFETEPPTPADCPTGFHRDTSGACVPNTVVCPPGKHEDESGNCVDDEGPNPTPTEPTKVKGIFVLKRDINIYRTDACEGTGGGGGSGGSAVFYDVPADNTKELSDTEVHFFRTRLATQLNNSASSMFNKVLKQLDVPLKKVGTPAASPTVTAVIWDKNNNVVYTSPTALDPTTLTTSFVYYSFDFSANTHIFVLGDRVGVRYFADSPTSDVNYVAGGYQEETTEGNTTMIQYQSSVWKEFTLRDWAAKMWS